jgi:hypothetical protein
MLNSSARLVMVDARESAMLIMLVKHRQKRMEECTDLVCVGLSPCVGKKTPYAIKITSSWGKGRDLREMGRFQSGSCLQYLG